MNRKLARKWVLILTFAAVFVASAAGGDLGEELVGVWSLGAMKVTSDDGISQMRTAPTTGKHDRIVFQSGGAGAMIGLVPRLPFRWEILASDRIGIAFDGGWNTFVVQIIRRGLGSSNVLLFWTEPHEHDGSGIVLTKRIEPGRYR